MNNQSDCNPCITAKVTYKVRQIVIEHTNVPQQVCCVCQKFLEAAESFARQYNIFQLSFIYSEPALFVV